jgi:hypothetical protein
MLSTITVPLIVIVGSGSWSQGALSRESNDKKLNVSLRIVALTARPFYSVNSSGSTPQKMKLSKTIFVSPSKSLSR